MIAKDTFPVFAQYNEDIILAALLSKVKKGFYVDVGANHEEYHSVTKYFYERGWSGINIEPIARLIAEFSDKRKRDINLQIAISQKKGKLELRDYPEQDGLSTLSAQSKQENEKINLPYEDYVVEVDSLEHVFTEHNITVIDFLKIDVEGYEFEVLKSNDWAKYRPTVVCIEANHRSNDWSTFLQKNDYVRVVSDGLNEYYLTQESHKLFDGFAERAALLAHNGLRNHHAKQWAEDIDRIKFLEDVTERQDALIKSTQHALEVTQQELAESRSLVLKLKAYKNKVKSALKRR